MSQEEIASYIAQCAKTGLTLPAEIAERAQQEIGEIDQILAEQERIAAKLYPRKTLLLQVMKTFGLVPVKNNKTIVPFISDTTTREELNEEQKIMLEKCYQFLTTSFQKNKPVVARDIMQSLQIKQENDVIVYSLIKWMGMEGIIKRQNGLIVAGENWNNK